MPSAIRLAEIYRYPVKGLSPERLDSVELQTSGYFPGDRLYAIENGPSGFNQVAPRHKPKIVYLMLMRNEALARLKTRLDPASRILTIEHDGEIVEADLGTLDGRLAVAAFLNAYLPHELRGEPWVLEGPPGWAFTDSPSGYVSIVNLASVRAVEDFVGAPVDRLRFRANLYLEGLEAWSELGMVGRIFEAPSGARLKVTKRTERCAATNVDPQTGIRDLAIPRALAQRFGHSDCGVYTEVVAGGTIRAGEVLSLIG